MFFCNGSIDLNFNLLSIKLRASCGVFDVLTIGGDKAAEITDNIALRFLKKANKKTVEEFANAPSAINSIPDAVIEQACIQNKIAQICKKNGLKFDNGIANKLYELG